MRLFLSAGEPSGDLHGGNLVRALQEACPSVDCSGFGGELMASAGCQMLDRLSQRDFTGFFKRVASVPLHARLLRQADEYFRTRRPDALVMVGYPGFHWWLARTARNRRIPVYYFMPPPLWAWGQWRLRKMRQLVDHVLCGLPFEETFFRQHHIAARCVGHPYFDTLAQQRLDGTFLASQRVRPGPIIGLLPGSGAGQIQRNAPSLLRAAALIHQRRPHVRFLVACLKAAHEREIKAQTRGLNLPIEVHSGRTPEIIQLSQSCLSVAGSVGLELLYRHKPAVVTCRQQRFQRFIGSLFMTCRQVSLVNLLADQEIYPEHLSSACRAAEMASQILHWLDDRRAYEEVQGRLKVLCGKVVAPGACQCAAEAILELQGRQLTCRQRAA